MEQYKRPREDSIDEFNHSRPKYDNQYIYDNQHICNTQFIAINENHLDCLEKLILKNGLDSNCYTSYDKIGKLETLDTFSYIMSINNYQACELVIRVCLQNSTMNNPMLFVAIHNPKIPITEISGDMLDLLYHCRIHNPITSADMLRNPTILHNARLDLIITAMTKYNINLSIDDACKANNLQLLQYMHQMGYYYDKKKCIYNLFESVKDFVYCTNPLNMCKNKDKYYTTDLKLDSELYTQYVCNYFATYGQMFTYINSNM